MDFEIQSGKTVLICDTEPIAMQGLSALLDSALDFRIVARTISLTDAGNMLEASRPAIVIVDRAFGIQAVTNFLTALRDGSGATSAIVWGMNIAAAEVPQLVEAGASGIVRKTADLETVLSCIQTVAAGRTWIQEPALRNKPAAARPAFSQLTGRELQVLELLERGMRNKDIASVLGVETGTVKIHIRHIFKKTGAHGRFELAIAGLKEKAVLTLPTV